MGQQPDMVALGMLLRKGIAGAWAANCCAAASMGRSSCEV